MNRKRQVLFIEDSIGLSGSTVSLCHLLSRLDYDAYEAHVVFSRPEQKAYLERYARVPAHTCVLARRESWQESTVARWAFRRAERLHPSVSRLLKRGVAALDLVVVTLPYALRLRRLCRARGIELIHHNNGFYVSLVLLGWLTGAPVIAYQRGAEWNSRTTRRLAPRIPRYVANSEATRRDLLALGVAAERIDVVYPPVDIERLTQSADCDAQRREFDLEPRQPTFGIVGHLLEWKGQHVFLAAAARVLAAVPEARAFVVGGAPAGVAAYVRRLQALARELGIEGRVCFTGFREDVPALMRMLDVVVHASIEPEPFGRVIVEAMALGRPVVATAAGGPLEIIRPGVNGLLVPPDDAPALAAAILALLADRERALRLGARGARDVAERFSVSAHAARMEEIYRRVLDAHGPHDQAANRRGSSAATAADCR